jgi:thiamine biosynthesis lipoprotein
MQTYEFRAMGCQMLAVVDGDNVPIATQLAAVPHWFEGWEQQLSRFRSDSDLSRLNATSDRPVAVPPALWEVLAVALDAARQSEGLVQPTILAALEAAGYDRSSPSAPMCAAGSERGPGA